MYIKVNTRLHTGHVEAQSKGVNVEKGMIRGTWRKWKSALLKHLCFHMNINANSIDYVVYWLAYGVGWRANYGHCSKEEITRCTRWKWATQQET